MRYLMILATIMIPAIIGCAATDEEKGPMERTGEYIDDSVEAGVETTKEFFSDSAITTRVKQRLLRDEHVSVFDIGITTKHGNVIVEGEVASEKLAERAMEIVLSTKGVRSAENHITIEKQAK